jgi:hypothetical protein
MERAEVEIGVELRVEIRFGDAECGAHLLDAFHGDLQIAILRQRDLNQLLQLRILKQIPPRHVGDGLTGHSRRIAPLFGHGDFGAFVVGTDGAGRRDERRAGDEERAREHVSARPPPSAAFPQQAREAPPSACP